MNKKPHEQHKILGKSPTHILVDELSIPISVPWYRKLLYRFSAFFVILAWCISHPKKFWKHVKRDFGIE